MGQGNGTISGWLSSKLRQRTLSRHQTHFSSIGFKIQAQKLSTSLKLVSRSGCSLAWSTSLATLWFLFCLWHFSAIHSPTVGSPSQITELQFPEVQSRRRTISAETNHCVKK